MGVDIVMIDSDDSFSAGASDDSDFDEFDEENVAPNIVKKGKKAAVKKAPTKKVAAKKAPKKKGGTKKASGKMPLKQKNIETEENSSNMDDTDDISLDDVGVIENNKNENSNKPKKTIEEMYQKKTQLEHILLRPDTYIGSVERITQPMYVLAHEGEDDRIVKREITYTPGLYKIYDEILVNAADNKQRDPNMDRMEITIDGENNSISVLNNGMGIPVAMHKEHDCYVPTLIFGHLLTGSNFDDDEKKTTGGRNGYGAKLANIFSTKFIVECVDSKGKKKFKQIFENNMGTVQDPIISKLSPKEAKGGDTTKITFSPDLTRFKMDHLDEDTVALMSKRAYDIVGSMANRHGKKLNVFLNGKKLSVNSFDSYLKIYKDLEAPVAYETVGDRWEVGVGPSDGSFQQVSFVNAICTSKGGGHTSYIADQIASHLVATVKKKNKGGSEFKANQIKNHICVYVNCLVENPAFDSQTKEFLTTRSKTFGSDCKLSTKFLKKIDKSDIIQHILAFAKFKDNQALKRTGGKKKIKLTGIAKLDDANFAGSAKSKDCTLIITEGDSAKSLAMSGLSVVGRDYYGVFPLKGKPLNVRDASHAQVVNNAEIKNIVDILGLKFGVDYDETNVKTLRYGHLMIMADQDHDGSHIKGLVINFIHNFWPTLLDCKGFLQQFITPIVKATKQKKSVTFFTLPEYDSWREDTGNDAKGWTIKYYKGLGTSTSAEAKDYFSNLEIHEVHFQGLTEDNTQLNVDLDAMDINDNDVVPDKQISGTDLIQMAFGKKRVEDRKQWLNDLTKGTYLNYSMAQKSGVKYSEFINKELILFSQASTLRSIPHIYDGFKPSQRKVLFACFKRKLKTEIKVAQLAGYIGEHAAYHHGEASLTGTVVNMAQNFCGSNNVNLLTPSGQFGTRRMGGQDAASPRYIFTKIEKITRLIFHPDDDALLTYLSDDGLSIEPEYYVPVLPMVLVNGAAGIGTGWSTDIPNYDPREVIMNIRNIIEGREIREMTPYFCGYNGEIIPGTKKGTYDVLGKIERVDDTTLLIQELPLKVWTQNYKEFLEKYLVGDKTKAGKVIEPCINDFRENHTDTTVSFTIIATKEKIDSFEKDKQGLLGKFKLNGTISTTNMHLFNERGQISKYESPEQILKVFYEERLKFYGKRKAYLLEVLERDKQMLSNRARFVEEICRNDLIVSNRKRKEILRELEEREYDLMPSDKKVKDDDESEDEDTNEGSTDAELSKGYEYLLGMKIWSLTFEKAEKLRQELEERTEEVAILTAKSPTSIWLSDLDEIDVALDEREAEMDEAEKEERKAQAKSKKKSKKKERARAKPKKKKKKNEWDSDESSEDEVMIHSPEDESFQAKQVPKKKKAVPKKRVEVTLLNEEEDMNFLSQSMRRTSITPVKPKRSIVYEDAENSNSDTASSPIVCEEIGNSNNDIASSPIVCEEIQDSNNDITPSEKAMGKKRTSAEHKISEVSKEISSSPKPKRKKAATKKKPVAKKPSAKKKPPQAVKKPPAMKKQQAARKKKELSEDELSIESCSTDEEEVPVVIAPRQRRGRATTKAKVNYVIEIDSESEASFGNDSDFS